VTEYVWFAVCTSSCQDMYNNHHQRKLDSQGRVCIPKRIRETYKLDGAKLEFFTENDLIILRRTDGTVFHPRLSIRDGTKGTSPCNFCLCSSCIGFKCPWSFGFVDARNTGEIRPARCRKCTGMSLEYIHDCDFYLSKKQKKIYRARIKKKEPLSSIIRKEIDELKLILKPLMNERKKDELRARLGVKKNPH
jgi:AbrB family looped-hinge helix DNA binding protein